MKISKGEHCSAFECTHNRGKNPNLSFFRFPKDEERCKRWLANTKRRDLSHINISTMNKKGMVLCADHFELSQFMNRDKKNRLIHNAEPTIFKIPNAPKLLNLDSDRAERTKRRALTVVNKLAKKRKESTANNIQDVPNQDDMADVLRNDNMTDVLRNDDTTDVPNKELIDELKNVNQNLKLAKQKIHTLEMRIEALQTEAKKKKTPTIDDVIKAASNFLNDGQLSFLKSQLACATKKRN